jgi:adenine-specific DNA-methyltransferase
MKGQRMEKPEMIKPEKMDLRSMDVAAEKREELKRCLDRFFPEIFAEGFVDFDTLKRAVGEWVDPNKERFGLNWPGKAECMRIVQQPSFATLKPMRNKSINFDSTENVFIEGDNLEVLKLLQKAYFGKLKLIYIDPPYNTGNEFIYPDKYSETLETYLQYTGQSDDQGRKFSTNTDAVGRYHTRWLNMMYPRLYLSRSLLRDDGVIFISIDDHEHANLKKMCDEVFGEENFISTVSRMMKSGGSKGRFFTPNIDYLLVYAKHIDAASVFKASITQEQIEGYYNKIQRDGPRAEQRYGEERVYVAGLDARPNQRYWIQCPDGSFVIPPGPTFPDKLAHGERVLPSKDDGVWKWIPETYNREFADGNILFKETSTSALIDQDRKQSKWNIYNKIWLKDQQEKGKVPSNFIGDFENRQSSAELKDLGIPFDFAKPTSLIKYILKIAQTGNSDLILDFFAGSGSVADAVVSLNAEDGGMRRSISVQLPEPTDIGTEAHNAGFLTISSLAIERMRRAFSKVEEVEKVKLFNSKKADYGFRVFSLAK